MKDAILKSISDCITNPNFRVGVYISKGKKLNLVANIVKEIFTENDFSEYLCGSQAIRIMRDCIHIIFANGSCIRVYHVNVNRRGIRSHEIIYDWEIEYEIVQTVLMASMSPYYIGDSIDDMKPDGVSFEERFIKVYEI